MPRIVVAVAEGLGQLVRVELVLVAQPDSDDVYLRGLSIHDHAIAEPQHALIRAQKRYEGRGHPATLGRFSLGRACQGLAA